MKILIILLSGLVLLASCDKENDNAAEVVKKPAQLLTQKQWILSKAGFDSNANGVVDDGENILADCQKGNIYTFRTTGTGSIQDIDETCTPPFVPDFSWKFLNEEKELEIGHQRHFILRLNENELSISPDLPLATPFILNYKH